MKKIVLVVALFLFSTLLGCDSISTEQTQSTLDTTEEITTALNTTEQVMSPIYTDEVSVEVSGTYSNSEILERILLAHYPTDVTSYHFINTKLDEGFMMSYQEYAYLTNLDDIRMYFHMMDHYGPTATGYYKDGHIIGKIEDGGDIQYTDVAQSVDEYAPDSFFEEFEYEFEISEVAPISEAAFENFGVVSAGIDSFNNFVITCQWDSNFTRLVLNEDNQVIYRYKHLEDYITEQIFEYSYVDVTYPQELEDWITQAEQNATKE